MLEMDMKLQWAIINARIKLDLGTLGFRVIDEKEPLTLNEAKTCELPNKSKLAMQAEIKALPANNGSCGTA